MYCHTNRGLWFVNCGVNLTYNITTLDSSCSGLMLYWHHGTRWGVGAWSRSPTLAANVSATNFLNLFTYLVCIDVLYYCKTSNVRSTIKTLQGKSDIETQIRYFPVNEHYLVLINIMCTELWCFTLGKNICNVYTLSESMTQYFYIYSNVLVIGRNTA